ncbi:MAG: hypothetical protein JO007_07380 [Alphaproteobacteria bacterium]|nr:hypothetical protein [Alphaproteobacteria bacterium]
MRILSTVAVLGLFAASCTPRIPVEPQFDVSALRATSDIPRAFAAFNRYDPRVNPLLAEQMCTTPFQPQVVRTAPAVPGEVLDAQVYCRTYQPFFARVYREQPTQ